jgi:hypothetical protein
MKAGIIECRYLVILSMLTFLLFRCYNIHTLIFFPGARTDKRKLKFLPEIDYAVKFLYKDALGTTIYILIKRHPQKKEITCSL